MKKVKSSGWMLVRVAVIGLCAAMALGQETTTIRPTPSEVESLLVMTKADFDAKLNSWISYNIMHVDRDKVKAELSTSRPAESILIFQCGNSAGIQQQTARDFAPLVDAYCYWAFRYTSKDQPTEGEMFWAGLDHPFINHVRKMRQICGATPIVAQLHANVSGRPTSLEEMQWQFIASLGCGYRGVLWPVAYRDVTWGDELKQIEEQIRRYGRFLTQAQQVDWVKADKDQAISVLACDGYLFVFLLNKAYMALGADGKSVSAPLDKPLCEGSLILTMPAGLKIRRGQTLAGKALRLAKEDSRTSIEYSFNTGGEMLIFTLAGKIKPAAIQPTTQPAATRPATAENEQ